VKELPHRVHESDPTIKVFVINVANLVSYAGSSSLCELRKQLSGNLVPCGTEEDFLKVILKRKVDYNPSLEIEDQIFPKV